ncbi:hypothetical protein [Moraxella boevrei]|uniref:hypothetical protein n=1 Tax=Faucicola boevrei TaxID=346665 RepID=UPI0037359BBC
MKIQNLLIDIKNINGNTSSQIIDEIYHNIFNEIANDHCGVYFDDKIWIIDELVAIYNQSNTNKKLENFIYALLNNLAYFEPQSGSIEIHYQVQESLKDFLDDES